MILTDKGARRMINYMIGSYMLWKGIVQEKWGHLSNSQLQVLVGRRNKLAGKMRRICNMNRDEAERALDREYGFRCSTTSSP